MALEDIGREEIIKVIKEYDKKEAEYMFETYGGGKSKRYYLKYEGKYYHQKLIVCAAHQRSKGYPIKVSATQTWKLLKKLGFVIVNSLLDLTI